MTNREYRRRITSDVWHWCRNCRWWPRSKYATRPKKPTTGELCNECLAKERNRKPGARRT